MLERFRRPRCVQLLRNERDWPEEAKDALHRGFKVTMVRGYDFRMYISNEPLVAINEAPPPVALADTTVTVRLDKLASATYEIPLDFPEEPRVLALALEIRDFIGPCRQIFIKHGSHRWHSIMLFYPKWTLKVSLLFWLRKLVGSDIRWYGMPGRLSLRGRLTVWTGWLPAKVESEFECG